MVVPCRRTAKKGKRGNQGGGSGANRLRLAGTPSGGMTARNLSVRAIVAVLAVLAALALAATLPNAAFGADSTPETSAAAGAEAGPTGNVADGPGNVADAPGNAPDGPGTSEMRRAMRPTARKSG